VSTLLTVVMERAVPSMYVESAEIVREPRGLYWIRITPNHILYWYWFKKIYPQWSRAVNKYVLKEVKQEFDRTCPEFLGVKILSNGCQILWVCRKEYKSFYESMRDDNG